jgi:hypothetical protein
MRFSKLILAVSVIALMAAGCSSYTPAQGSGAAVTPKVAGPRSGTEIFTLSTSSGVTNPVFLAVASGVFQATGAMQPRSSASSASLHAWFPGGTFEVDFLSKGIQSRSINSRTCLVLVRGDDTTYKITNGTGKYRGISGAGVADVEFSAKVARVRGECPSVAAAQKADPVAGSTSRQIHAAGRVHLP